ncbi:hypothetical protein GQR58_012119 [Nymphon striatum]|nr:hypothetical protein GQR58_012119 [Nymphon striatum]
MPNDPTGSATTISAVSMKLPEFCSASPTVWFAHADAQFHLRSIADQKTKFYYVVAALPKSVALRITDLFQTPPADVDANHVCLGETCSHVAALLFKLEYTARQGIASASCTELPCKWNVTCTKDIVPTVIAQIKFYKPKSLRSSQWPAPIEPSLASIKDEKRLLNYFISAGKLVVAFSVIDGYTHLCISKQVASRARSFPKPVRGLYNPRYERISSADLEKVLRDVKSNILISQEEVESIECCSRGQTSSMVWHEQRVGRITASVSHQAFHTDSNRPALSLIKKICSVSSSPLNHVRAIEWGQTNEEDSFQVYKYINLGTLLPRTCVMEWNGMVLWAHQHLKWAI